MSGLEITLKVDMQALLTFVNGVQDSLTNPDAWRRYFAFLGVVLPATPTDYFAEIFKILV